MRQTLAALPLIAIVALAACDSGPHVVATATTPAVEVAANLSSGAAGAQLRILNPQELPEAIRQAKELSVSVDSSKTSLPVIREADGSLTVNFGQLAPKLDTDGNVTVLFILDKQYGRLVTLKTGPSISLGTPAIMTDPSPASVLKGFSLGLKANVAASQADRYTYTWSYSAQPASGMWTPISGNAPSVDWTPPSQGNYYVRLEVTDKATQKNTVYTSPSALVFVGEGKDIITTSPFPANLDRGQEVGLSLTQATKAGAIYSWAYSVNPAAGWQPITSGNNESARGASVSWLPPNEGNYYIKVDISDPATRTTSSFTSSQALVFVSETSPLIYTEPNPARVLTNSGVTLRTRLEPKPGDTFGWSYGSSQMGPWTAIGGSTVGHISWSKSRPVGTYYIKLDVSNASKGTVNSFVSKTPLVYVEQGDGGGPTFGQ